MGKVSEKLEAKFIDGPVIRFKKLGTLIKNLIEDNDLESGLDTEWMFDRDIDEED